MSEPPARVTLPPKLDGARRLLAQPRPQPRSDWRAWAHRCHQLEASLEILIDGAQELLDETRTPLPRNTPDQ